MGEYLAMQQDMRDMKDLLRQLDGHLGLAVHRGEGCDTRWLREATEYIDRIRRITGDDER